MTSEPPWPPWGLFHIYHQPLWSPPVTSIFRKGAIRMWAGCCTVTNIPTVTIILIVSQFPLPPSPRFVSFVLGIITVFLPIPFVPRQLFISPLLLNLSALSTNQGCQLFSVSTLVSPSVSPLFHTQISYPHVRAHLRQTAVGLFKINRRYKITDNRNISAPKTSP